MNKSVALYNRIRSAYETLRSVGEYPVLLLLNPYTANILLSESNRGFLKNLDIVVDDGNEHDTGEHFVFLGKEWLPNYVNAFKPKKRLSIEDDSMPSPEEILHLGQLVPDPANARVHSPRNVGMIEDSIQECGFGRSLLIDENNVIIAGNATAEAAGSVGLEKVRVIDIEGDEVVALRRKNLSPEQKARLGLFDNRTAELADGWDVEVLKKMIEDDVPMDNLWTDKELERLLATSAVESDEETQEGEQGLFENDSSERDETISVGKYRFLISREEFTSWMNDLTDEVGEEKEIVIAEIRRRLGL